MEKFNKKMNFQSSFFINQRKISSKDPCFVIAEVAQAHDGSLGFAHSFIDAAADAKADAIKFQTHIAHAESSKEEKFRVKFSYEDKNRYNYWKRMEFSSNQWKGLYDHAREKGLIFLSSAFSEEAVEMLDEIGIPAWKVGSGETINYSLISKMLRTKKPILLSTGMSTWKEIEDTLGFISNGDGEVALFQCTSEYPTNYTQIGLNVIEEFNKKFNVPVGLSDHSGSIYPSIAAIAGKASLVEVHISFHPSMFGPDVTSSITFEELSKLTEARDAIYLMKNSPVNKDNIAKKLSITRSLFNKSIALKKNQPAGTILTNNMLTFKKPGTGIKAKYFEKCIGKKLKIKANSNVLLKWEDLE